MVSRLFPVALARGKHLFPFRTEQLSPSAPMVLGSQGPGRVGRRRFFLSTGRQWRPVFDVESKVAFDPSNESEASAAALRLLLPVDGEFDPPATAHRNHGDRQWGWRRGGRVEVESYDAKLRRAVEGQKEGRATGSRLSSVVIAPIRLAEVTLRSRG